MIVTCGRYGKLYAYFRAIAKDVINKKINAIGFPKEGNAMYDYLREKIDPRDIKDWKYLSKIQREILLPKDEVIKVGKLDVTIYIQIIILLEGEQEFMLFLINKRNILCHLSIEKLKEDLTDKDFQDAWYLTTRKFIKFDVDRTLLKRCEEDIYKRKRIKTLGNSR